MFSLDCGCGLSQDVVHLDVAENFSLMRSGCRSIEKLQDDTWMLLGKHNIRDHHTKWSSYLWIKKDINVHRVTKLDIVAFHG